MFDGLAVGWNLAMVVTGAYVVSLSARTWPLSFDRRQALTHTLLGTLTGLLVTIYPHSVLSVSSPEWLNSFGDLRFISLVTVMLAYRPVWAVAAALLICLPELSQLRPGTPRLSPDLLALLVGVVGVLVMAYFQKGRLGFLNFSLREAAWRLPLIFLPISLGPVLAAGWKAGLWPGLALAGLNLLGFLAGMTVVRSRFRLLAISARLSRQAHTDPLTGLWNRRQLEQDLLDLPVGGQLLIVDLDYFKTINDRFGHEVGDEYLVHTADALSRALRDLQGGGRPLGTGERRTYRAKRWAQPRRRAYRMGGEEFALLTSEAAPTLTLAESVMAQVRQVRHRSNPGGQITCSVGVAQRLAGETPQQTLRRADMALMQAKANGRDRLEIAGTLVDIPATGLMSDSARPAQPLLWEAIHASMSLAALDRDLTGDDWTRLLQAAILSVPGAESGSINVLQGNHFLLCAQIGFSDQLLRLEHSEQEQLDWYGLGLDAWKRGQPRVLYGEAIAQHSNTGSIVSPDVDHSELFQTYGRVTELRASLCIPVLMDGEVVGHLNLDRSSDPRPFDAEDLRVARAFADQVTVLTVAARRRQQQAQQRQAQDWLLSFSLDLLTFRDADSIVAALLRGLSTLLETQGQLVLDGTPAPTTDDPALYVLALDWPGVPTAHLRFYRHAGYSAQDRRLLRQAARAANAALLNLKPEATATG